MNKPPRIPPPPPNCYPSCNKDFLIADRLGKYAMRAAIVFGVIFGTISGILSIWGIHDAIKHLSK